MEIGLLWCDGNKKKTLEERGKEAVAAYGAKPRFAGEKPDACYVHPSMLNGEQGILINSVRVSATPIIAPHHLLVGVEQSGANERDQPEKKRQRQTKRASRRRKRK
jgi:hypothetical protein